MKPEFQADNIFQIEGRGVVATGTVKNGIISKGMVTNINGKTAIIEAIEFFDKISEIAKPGDNCGLLLKGIEKEDIKTPMTIYFEEKTF
ncbi:MAG: hypothetical protein KatS3mg095_0522 [Candidatus Parcubacteria bacterium]|nr:MAG: hypothetical protein KatS3mg095_0522 [Candidatus Parcubacteria bacterium]